MKDSLPLIDIIPPIPEDMFYFELISDSGAVLQRIAAASDGTVTFSPIDYTQLDVGNTYTYQIREVVDEEFIIDGVLYDTHTETVQVIVKNDKDGNIILTVNRESEEAQFNNLALFDLEIFKTVSLGNQNETFNFILTLENEKYDLSGVTYTKDSKTDRLSSLKSENGDWYEFTLKHNETIRFNNLPYATLYSIKETADNYETWVVTTSADEEEVIYSKETDGMLEDDVSIRYANSLIAVLPSSGNIGAKQMYLFGFAFILISSLIFLHKHRYNYAKVR